MPHLYRVRNGVEEGTIRGSWRKKKKIRGVDKSSKKGEFMGFYDLRIIDNLHVT